MTCIIREIFNYPCPTCGVTRALWSLANFDLKNYYYYNIMALPLCISTILMIVGTKKKVTLFTVLSIVILILNYFYYIYRCINKLIP